MKLVFISGLKGLLTHAVIDGVERRGEASGGNSWQNQYQDQGVFVMRDVFLLRTFLWRLCPAVLCLAIGRFEPPFRIEIVK